MYHSQTTDYHKFSEPTLALFEQLIMIGNAIIESNIFLKTYFLDFTRFYLLSFFFVFKFHTTDTTQNMRAVLL